MSARRRAPFVAGDDAATLLAALAAAVGRDPSLSLSDPAGFSRCVARRHLRDRDLWHAASEALLDRLVHHYRPTMAAWVDAVAPGGLLVARPASFLPDVAAEDLASLAALPPSRWRTWRLNAVDAVRDLFDEVGAESWCDEPDLDAAVHGRKSRRGPRSRFDLRQTALLLRQLEAEGAVERWKRWSRERQSKWIAEHSCHGLIVARVPASAVLGFDDGREEERRSVEWPNSFPLESHVRLRGLRPEHVVKVFLWARQRPSGARTATAPERAAFALDGALQVDAPTFPWVALQALTLHEAARRWIPEGLRVRALPSRRPPWPLKRPRRQDEDGEFVPVRGMRVHRRHRRTVARGRWYVAEAS